MRIETQANRWRRRRRSRMVVMDCYGGDDGVTLLFRKAFSPQRLRRRYDTREKKIILHFIFMPHGHV